MSIVSVDNIQPIGSGTSVTINSAATLVLTNANSTGVITATSFVGSGANLTSLPAQATIANNADNRIITGGSGVNLNGESTLTYDGTNLDLGDNKYVRLGASNDFQMWHNGGTGNTNIKQVTGDMYFYTGSDLNMHIKDGTSVDLYYANSKKFETTSSGATLTGDLYATSRLLVNTTSPGESNGDEATFANPSGNAGITIRSAVNNECKIYFSEGTSGGSQYRGAINYNQNTNYMAFSTNEYERMRVDSDGRLLIGITSLSASNGSADGVCLRAASGERNFSRGSTVTRDQIAFYNPNGLTGRIQSSGSSTNYVTSSDYRLKENVTAISDGITRLKTLKPYRFNFKADSTTTVDGFFAHEVTAVPEAISGTKDEVDSDNNPVYQGIDQSKLVPLLTAALQEAIAEIETLKTKVAALEGS